jgi:acyl-CoA synthetase (AMP-forming)/AMP-acid ligase II
VFGKSAFARHPTVTAPDKGWMMPVGYGLSETCAFFVSHWSTTPRELTKKSMGRLLPGNQLRIVDPESGRTLDVDDEGELAIKGPTLMKRYLGKAPEECFDADGFFHTGDAGHVDPDGYVHFTGRRTEMIKTGGANVSPAELEVQLRACPPVKLSRIVGVPDPRLDQIVVACITLKDGAEATEDDIRSFLKDRVAAYKVPKRVLFFDDGEIPMTSSDTKVRDDALLGLVRDRLAQPVPTTTGDR